MWWLAVALLSMPRKLLLKSKTHPYHVTARSNNKEPFPCSLEKVWEIFSTEIQEISAVFSVKTHAFLLMPNHFHLLLSTTKEDLGVVMRLFMAKITKKINSKTGRSGRIFGAAYHWCLIDNESYYDCALKYVYRNPVKAGLCSFVESYPFSTLPGILGSTHAEIVISPAIGHELNVPGGNYFYFLKWLNKPFLSEENQAIDGGLKKQRFGSPKPGWKRKSVNLIGYSPPH